MYYLVAGRLKTTYKNLQTCSLYTWSCYGEDLLGRPLSVVAGVCTRIQLGQGCFCCIKHITVIIVFTGRGGTHWWDTLPIQDKTSVIKFGVP